MANRDTTIKWLRDIAEDGGKGVVNNIDARCLGRIADDLERMQKALEKIANPILFFQQYAKQEGRQLDGQVVVQLANNSAWLRNEAASALALPSDQCGGQNDAA